MNEKIALQEGWQGGPAWIELEVDELELDSGAVEAGVIFKIDTPCDPSGGMELELGTGKLTLPGGPGRLEFWIAASMEQATALRDALSLIVDRRWDILHNTWPPAPNENDHER